MADSELTFASSSVNQVITLSAGILGFSITLITSKTSSVNHTYVDLLEASWAAFLFSIVCGVWSLSAITGLVASKKVSSKSLWLRVPWGLELVAFIAGLVTFAIFGFNSV
jgi:hypothetical protein